MVILLAGDAEGIVLPRLLVCSVVCIIDCKTML